jgi:hypothetical protein
MGCFQHHSVWLAMVQVTVPMVSLGIAHTPRNAAAIVCPQPQEYCVWLLAPSSEDLCPPQCLVVSPLVAAGGLCRKDLHLRQTMMQSSLESRSLDDHVRAHD